VRPCSIVRAIKSTIVSVAEGLTKNESGKEGVGLNASESTRGRKRIFVKKNRWKLISCQVPAPTRASGIRAREGAPSRACAVRNFSVTFLTYDKEELLQLRGSCE
jgi:hypothetical protein